MGFHEIAGTVCRALTAKKDGPRFMTSAIPCCRNTAAATRIWENFIGPRSAIRRCGRCLRRTGLPELRDEARLGALRAALAHARDDAAAGLVRGRRAGRGADGRDRVRHPAPPAAAPGWRPNMPRSKRVIRACGAHLLRAYAKNGFIPTYAAFNLIGDADIGGREFLMALTGLNSRGYKNSTLLFNLARIFIARSPARALINPSWRGIAEPMWQPMQIRHRSAYYDAFFTEALLSFVESGLASPQQTDAARGARLPTWWISA